MTDWEEEDIGLYSDNQYFLGEDLIVKGHG
jgi:hypothetical protein